MSSRTIPREATRRGLNREEAAIYFGVSASKFDQLRKDGRVGPAKLIDGRKVWDMHTLDEAFDALPSENENNDEEEWRAIL